MSVDAGRAKLNQALKDLLAQWHHVQSSWRDAASRDFEAKQLHPLESDVRTGLGAMERLGEVLHRVRRECK